MLLAFILLILWRVNKPLEFHIDMDLYSQDQGNLQKDKLELTNTCKKADDKEIKEKEKNISAYVSLFDVTDKLV